MVLVLTIALALAIAPPPLLAVMLDQPEVGVALTLEGSDSQGAGGRLQEAVRMGLDRSGVGVVDYQAVSPPPEGCGDAECWKTVAGDAGASHLVVGTVTVEGRDYAFELELIDAETGAVVASNSDRCEICGIDEVADLISSKAATLGHQLTSQNQGAPVLVVDSNPTGARVTVDGKNVGTTPFEAELPPGLHVIRVEKRGHVTVERELELAAGVRSEAAFALERVNDDRELGKGIRPAGWALLGGGLGVLGAGVGLLAIDDSEAQGRCDGNNVDDEGDCKFLRNTMWGGASLAVVGGAAVAAGALILAITRGNKLPAGNRAQLVPSVGPGTIGVAGRF